MKIDSGLSNEISSFFKLKIDEFFIYEKDCVVNSIRLNGPHTVKHVFHSLEQLLSTYGEVRTLPEILVIANHVLVFTYAGRCSSRSSWKMTHFISGFSAALKSSKPVHEVMLPRLIETTF